MTKRNAEMSTKEADVSPAFRAEEVTAEDRYRMIAENAYSRAQKRGFLEPGSAEDWLLAEIEIDQMLNQARTSDS